MLIGGGGAVGLGLRATNLVNPQSPLKGLTPASYSILSAVADRLIPDAKGFPRPRDVQVVEKIDDKVTLFHPKDLEELNTVLGLFESALFGFLFDQRLAPFTQLTGEQQDAAIVAWRDSRVTLRRSVHLAIHALVMSAYYGSAEVYEAVGYPGPPEILR